MPPSHTKPRWRPIRLTVRFLSVLMLIFSLGLNIAFFVGGTIYAAASSAFDAVTGLKSVATRHSDEVTDFSKRINTERRLKHELQSKVAGLSENLRIEKQASRQLRNKLDEATLGVIAYRGSKVTAARAVADTRGRIAKRASVSATRNVGSMFGEAVPWIGTSVIVGVTAMELYDLCEMTRDMNELHRAFDPDVTLSEDKNEVCGMRVPTKEEVWQEAKSSPQNAWNGTKKVWRSAADTMPSLEEVQAFDLPDIDWDNYQLALSGAISGAYDATSDTVGGL